LKFVKAGVRFTLNSAFKETPNIQRRKIMGAEELWLLWNFIQQANQTIQKNSEEGVGVSKAEATEYASRVVAHANVPHAEHLDKLLLICQAMWELVKEKTDLKDEDLLKMVTELDLKDGKPDGKYTKPPVDCPKCGAKICRKFNRCFFCGQEYSEGSVFDTV
jgi:hypothetical protein